MNRPGIARIGHGIGIISEHLLSNAMLLPVWYVITTYVFDIRPVSADFPQSKNSVQCNIL